MTQSNTRVSFILYLLYVSFIIDDCTALESISRGLSLSGKQSLVSKDGNFELGFFKPGEPSKFYIGIWYKKIKRQTVIWVANRDMPVYDMFSSELKVAEDGNLVLLDNLKVRKWSSYMKPSTWKSMEAVLLDTGNLVIREEQNPSVILWQSFDQPTDTFVSGSRLGLNKITGEYLSLVSWKNAEDPATGIFTYTIDPSGKDQFLLLWNKTQSYWTSGIWNGQYLPSFPETMRNRLFNVSFVENDVWKGMISYINNSSTIIRLTIAVTGQIKLFEWLDSIQDWSLIWSEPLDQCDIYLLCGSFGICNRNAFLPCTCPQGFRPATPSYWKRNDSTAAAGCQRITDLQCTEKDQFYAMSDMELPGDSQPLHIQSSKECELACLKNCSCIAYTYVEVNQCMIWYGNIQNLKQVDGDDGTGQIIYLRIQGPKFSNGGDKHRKVVLIAALIAAGFLAFIIIAIVLLAFRCHRKTAAEKERIFKGSLNFFTYSDLRRATMNFSQKLGRGSFGTVYKGVLKDSTKVAVKKLQGLKQGEKQFRAEVNTLGLIQHLNLVQLIGFCSEGTNKLLVYEFMPNGSLASFLFRKSPMNLTWNSRYEIGLGIARGLAYLHEECRECIIHCDIKPENILLDSELRPKIADFGMAKLIGRDFSRVLTTIRGTVGYLAPEWISGLPITTKSDVYSFGMVLFELVSGRRNAGSASVTETNYFPAWAASRTNTGNELLGLVDDRIKDDVDMVELARVCKVACWCIQDSESDRPSMSLVVKIMEGVMELNVPPFPKSLLQAL